MPLLGGCFRVVASLWSKAVWRVLRLLWGTLLMDWRKIHLFCYTFYPYCVRQQTLLWPVLSLCLEPFTVTADSFSDSTSPSRKIVLICLPRFILPCTEHIVLLREVENRPDPPVPPLPPAPFLIAKADSVSRSLTVRVACIPLTTLPRHYTTWIEHSNLIGIH